MMFLVDSNVLIEAKNRYYAFDIAPGFWRWLDIAHGKGRACSIEKVRDELLRGDDELSGWVQSHRGFFFPPDERTVRVFPGLATWAESQCFTQEALNGFTSDAADFMLVAHASAHSCTVVTHEMPGTGSRKRVKIPDACEALGVAWVDTFDMLRRTGATLELAS
ncbi:MAG: DUF4411 family protein [Propionibacterium acidifaciens]